MSADDKKIPHYDTQYQHWSFVEKCNLDYFSGNSTKYVTRWRKKNGIDDLRKALHYLAKMEEVVASPPVRKLSYEETLREVGKFCEANQLSYLERAYIVWLCTWRVKEDLAAAREVLFFLFDEAEALLLKEGAKPVPLEEENHYSERYTGA